MLDPNERRRPRQESGATTPAKKSLPSVARSAAPRIDVVASGADAVSAPCRRCGHALSAPRSVSRGLGPVCVDLVAAGGERR